LFILEILFFTWQVQNFAVETYLRKQSIPISIAQMVHLKYIEYVAIFGFEAK